MFFSLIVNKCLKKPPPPSEKMVGGVGSLACPNQDQDQNQDKEGCFSATNCLLGLTSTTGTNHHHHHHHHHHQEASNHPKLRSTMTTTTTTRISRSNFTKSTTSSLFPNTQFTNHESLPCLLDALSSFNQTYPQYKDTQEADRIRQHHYSHLSHHVCLDYTGFTLFSHSQLSSSPFFGISYKSASTLTSQVQYGSGNKDTSSFESAIRNKIMSFLNVSPEDYTMVCTANRTSAFKLLVEAYPFHSSNMLLTVYDYESEAVSAMQESALKRGAKVMSATFSWPNLRIHSSKLKKMLTDNNKNKKKKNDKRNNNNNSNDKKKRAGVFVFPLQSRMTGTRYPYLWMRFAQENGWHVVLDACALGPKELDTFGLSLIQPDFIICSFYKVVGQDPSGFAALLINKSSRPSLLVDSVMGSSIGIVSIVPAPASTTERFEQGETSYMQEEAAADKGKSSMITSTSEIVELESNITIIPAFQAAGSSSMECLGLDHADSLGLLLISSRLRYLTNWLVIALLKLRHPNSEINGHPLVRIYGPRIKFERGASIAFNVFDWKGEKVEPALVQKLADRFNISLSCGFLHNICFSDKYEEEREAVLEKRSTFNIINDVGIAVVNASLGFLTNFEDAYKLWSFVARFLDADFVEKERWRYMALNQKMIEV